MQGFGPLLAPMLISLPDLLQYGVRLDSTPTCKAVYDRLRTPASARIQRGTYRLTVVFPIRAAL